jgi:cyclase
MTCTRLIGRLDIKGPNLIKGIHLEGLRVVGDPRAFATRYFEQGVDELFYQDSVASLYQRNSLQSIVEYTSERIFVPLTVAGGIRSVEDARALLRAGADKVAVNSAAVRRPSLVREISEEFGSQCMVLSVEAKSVGPGRWEPFTDTGREATGLDLMEWVQQATALGAGEIFLTSIDKDGTRRGFDLAMTRAVADAVAVPVVASGGFGKPPDFVRAVHEGHADAVAVGAALHFGACTPADIRAEAGRAGIAMRSP